MAAHTGEFDASYTRQHHPETPGQNGARQRLWNAMRVYKTFTVLKLEIITETGPDNIKKYVQALYRAGYLRQERPKQNGKDGGSVIWRLVVRKKPLAPIVRRDKSGIYDPNSDQFIPFQKPKEPVKKERIHERLSETLPCTDQATDSAVEEGTHARAG